MASQDSGRLCDLTLGRDWEITLSVSFTYKNTRQTSDRSVGWPARKSTTRFRS